MMWAARGGDGAGLGLNIYINHGTITSVLPDYYQTYSITINQDQIWPRMSMQGTKQKISKTDNRECMRTSQELAEDVTKSSNC